MGEVRLKRKLRTGGVAQLVKVFATKSGWSGSDPRNPGEDG